jgi:hypothetical protein
MDAEVPGALECLQCAYPYASPNVLVDALHEAVYDVIDALHLLRLTLGDPPGQRRMFREETLILASEDLSTLSSSENDLMVVTPPHSPPPISKPAAEGEPEGSGSGKQAGSNANEV